MAEWATPEVGDVLEMTLPQYLGGGVKRLRITEVSEEYGHRLYRTVPAGGHHEEAQEVDAEEGQAADRVERDDAEEEAQEAHVITAALEAGQAPGGRLVD